MLRTIFEHAKRKKLVAANPAVGVKKYSDGRQRRFLTLDEITTLGEAMRDAEAAGEGGTGLPKCSFLPDDRPATDGALALPWAWVDGRARCIPVEDTKSGAQLRPIGTSALKMLESLPRRAGCPWAFPAQRGDGHFIGLPRVLERVCSRAALDGVTVHVLRHSFAATAAEMGFSELTIAGLLGHTVASGKPPTMPMFPISAGYLRPCRSGPHRRSLDGIGEAEVAQRAIDGPNPK